MKNINFNDYRNNYYRKKKCQKIKNNMRDIKFNNNRKFAKINFHK